MTLPMELGVGASDQRVEMTAVAFKGDGLHAVAVQHDLVGAAGGKVIIRVANRTFKLTKISLYC